MDQMKSEGKEMSFKERDGEKSVSVSEVWYRTRSLFEFPREEFAEILIFSKRSLHLKIHTHTHTQRERNSDPLSHC